MLLLAAYAEFLQNRVTKPDDIPSTSALLPETDVNVTIGVLKISPN
jgi:hypothetical protein